MAKHPVPKKKVASSTSKIRYAEFVRKKHKRLKPFLSVKPCPSCGAPMLPFITCSQCGKFRGKQVINLEKKIEKKITKIRA